ncbi:hypothetical protein Tco_0428918, partial [Tanacetum coccineum]
MDSNPSSPLGSPVKKEGCDASADSTAEVDPGLSAPNDSIPQQQGMDEGTKNTSYDHIFAGKGANSIARQVKEEEASSTIKLEDLAKLVSNVEPSFKDPDSPEDDPVIVVDDSDKDEEDEVHPTPNAKTEDTLVHKSPSPSELLVKSLKSEFSKILSTHDFSSSLPTKLKDLPSKFNDLTEEWELPAEFLVVPSQVNMIQAKLKTLDALPSLLNKVINALNQLAQAITSNKTGGDSVPSAGQAGTQLAEGGKNTNQAIISQLFQRRAKKENLNKQQPNPTTPPNPLVITTQMQSQSSSQPEGEHIK